MQYCNSFFFGAQLKQPEFFFCCFSGKMHSENPAKEPIYQDFEGVNQIIFNHEIKLGC